MIIYKRDYLVFGLGITIIVMNLFNVIVNNSVIDKGEELAEVEAQLKQIKLENVELEEDYLTKTSLTYINKEAKKQGFVEAKRENYIYLYK